MANETRPRRESSSTSRIRKAAMPAPTSPAADDAGREPARPHASAPDPVEPPAPAGNDYRDRDRVEREPYREERPADREPIRLIRDRDRTASRPAEREPGLAASANACAA